MANDESGECDFGLVELRFAMPDMDANRLTDLAYHRLHRFIRLWKKLGWSIATTDRAITVFLGGDLATLTVDSIDAAFTDLLARLAAFATLTDRLEIPAKKRGAGSRCGSHDRRRGGRDQLAALLRVGTTDLAHLVAITGVDPLADDLATDEPSMLRFTEHVAALKASPLKVVDLDYLLRHDDLTGKLTPSDEACSATSRPSAMRSPPSTPSWPSRRPPPTWRRSPPRWPWSTTPRSSTASWPWSPARSPTAAPLVTPEEVLPVSLSELAPASVSTPSAMHSPHRAARRHDADRAGGGRRRARPGRRGGDRRPAGPRLRSWPT